MNKITVSVIAAVLIVAAVLAFNPPAGLAGALAATDVTAKYAKSAFGKMLDNLPQKPVADAAASTWTMSAPDGSAKLTWVAKPGSQNRYDIVMRTPAAPFVAAGLDVSRLPADLVQDGMITFGLEARPMDMAGTSAVSPASSFASLLDERRGQIAYHFQLKHFGIDLGGGILLEWAGDPVANSLDLVFVLDPDALLKAGVDKDKDVEGWVSGSVIVHDSKGRKVEVPKFLKPFNLL